MKNEKEYLFDNPRNVQWLMRGFYACCAVLLGLELVVHRHTEHTWEGLIGFYPLYGFIGCVVLVLIAKWMRGLLMRPEDYYASQNAVGESESLGEGSSKGETAR